MSDILLGTSGWSYAEWEGILYPKKQGKLKQYSSVFPTVEINSTFYALPKPEIVLGWTRHTPSNFLYSAKLHQVITHKKTLNVSKGIETDLNQFLIAMKPLIDAGKLACILVQLPPYLKFDAERLESFLSLLPDVPNFSVEFRHLSWLQKETITLLEKYGVAYTVVDEPLLPPVVHVTSQIAYFRWHGKGKKPWFNYQYSEEELKESIPRVREATENAEKVLGYFNNHFHGYAPENCLQIMQMLGIITPHGPEALQRVTFYRKEKDSASTPARPKTLEAWTGPIEDTKIEKLLKKIADDDTIEKARSVPDKDFSLREDSKRGLAAYIGDTTVEINLKHQVITHYCPMWSKTSRKKRVCQHIIKLFLEIDRERAQKILSSIIPTREKWKFQSRLAVEFPE